MLPLDFISIEILLPFFLVLAIVYGALEVSHIFRNKAVKGIIAVVFAFFSVMNYEVVMLINSLLPYAALFFIALFFFWFIKKPFSGGGKSDPVLVIIILGLVLIFFARLIATENIPEYSFLANPNLLWAAGLVIILLILWKAYKTGSQ